MSDTISATLAAEPAADAVASAVPPAPAAAAAAPLDLAGYEAGPAVDPKLRMVLLMSGGQITTMMARKGATPETVAKQLSLPEDLIYNVMTGREADVGVATLSRIANAVGCTFILGLQPIATGDAKA